MLFKTLIFTILVPGAVTLIIPLMLLPHSIRPPLRLGVFRYTSAILIYWALVSIFAVRGTLPLPGEELLHRLRPRRILSNRAFIDPSGIPCMSEFYSCLAEKPFSSNR